MPRPTRAQGRPGTAVIPTGWETGHAPVVAKTMTAQVSIRPPGETQQWSPEAEQMVLTPHVPYYTDGARIQVLGQQARQARTAEDPETVASYLVVVPGDIAPPPGGLEMVDHLIEVTDSGDPLLDGRVLVVREVVYGSQRFERDLFCQLIT